MKIWDIRTVFCIPWFKYGINMRIIQHNKTVWSYLVFPTSAPIIFCWMTPWWTMRIKFPVSVKSYKSLNSPVYLVSAFQMLLSIGNIYFFFALCFFLSPSLLCFFFFLGLESLINKYWVIVHFSVAVFILVSNITTAQVLLKDW